MEYSFYLFLFLELSSKIAAVKNDSYLVPCWSVFILSPFNVTAPVSKVLQTVNYHHK